MLGPQTDFEFLEAVGVPAADQPMTLAIRRVLGEWCGVPTEYIRADARPIDLSDRMKSGWFRGWDEGGFLMKLEDHLGITIDPKTRLPAFIGGRFLFWKREGAGATSSWIKETAAILRERIKT